MDDIKNKRKRNIVIEAAMKSIKDSLTGKHGRGILGNIEQNLRCAYRRGYADAQEEFAESNVQKHDDSLIRTNNELVSESDVIYRQSAIDAIEQAIINYDSAIMRVVNMPQTEFKIYVVSWISCGVPVVTAFNNYDAAKRCYDAFKTKEGKCLDLVPVYSNFIDYGEIENE